MADEDSNSLLIATSAKLYDRVTAILDDLDRPVPQVLIKVLLAEVTHTNGSDIGLEFSYVNTRLNGMGTKVGTDFGLAQSSGGFAVSMIEGDFQVALKALATANKLDVLSRPYILASDNQLASIIIGQQVPFITNTRITDTGQTVNTVQYQDIGIILNVTPHINPDGKVIMDVAPEISSLTDSSVTISQGVNAQIFNRRAAQSRIAIDNGRTVVIGGLMEDRKSFREDKVPILGDIPWLGDLFKHRIDSKTKTELLIFLTPHVAMDSNVLHPMSKDEVQGLKIVPNAVQPGTFQEHLEGMRRQSTTTQPVEPLNVPPTDFSREPAKLPGK